MSKKRPKPKGFAPSGQGGGGCFVAGTLIHTPSGLRPIEDIKIGEWVDCFDCEGRLQRGQVYDTSSHPNHQTFKFKYWGGSFVGTANHFVFTEDNSFQEIGEFEIDQPLYTKEGSIRPYEGFEPIGRATVYNFRVRDFHTYLVGEAGIRVHNGGGGKAASSPEEETDSGRSTSKGSVVELLSEGVCEGLVGGLKGIYLDQTPVQNNDGTKNFKGFKYKFRSGIASQSVIELDDQTDIAQENNVNVEVKKSQSPVIRSIVNPELDAIRVRLEITLQEYEEDGDIKGSEIRFKIYTKKGNEAAKVRIDRTVKGKFSSPIEFQYEMSVTNSGGNVSEFQVWVERVTNDSTSQRLVQRLTWKSFTEVIKNKVNYAYSCVVGMEFDAEQFSSIPQRRFKLAGIRIPIPSNATVAPDRGLDFAGTWDGRFYTPSQAVGDPAWILYSLLVNDRWGLGKYIRNGQVDKWSLYETSRYNNRRIPDGLGGEERRYQCFTQIQTKEKALDILNAVASAANMKLYWSEGTIKVWQDRPGKVVKQFTQADVENGVFIYSSTAVRSRYTLALVTWNDPNNFYERTVEPVEDVEGIDKYGIQTLEIAAFGCCSRARAIRAGKWALYSSRFETETVTFKARSFATLVRPGDIIEVADPKRANIRYGGLIRQSTQSSIRLDAPVVLSGSGFKVTVMLGSGTLETRDITNPAGNHEFINVANPFSEIPPIESTWIIRTDQVKPQVFRVLAVTPERNDPTKVEITAIQHNPGKYALIEEDIDIQPTQTRLGTPTVTSPPSFVNALVTTATTAGTTLIVEWVFPNDPFIKGALVEWTIDGLTWQGTQTVGLGANSYRYAGMAASIPYAARVASIDLNGRYSQWVYSAFASPVIVPDA